MYTTVEGLLTTVRDKLLEVDPTGDSADAGKRASMAAFFAGLEACIRGEREFTLRLVDPMANTWMHSNTVAEGGEDARLSHHQYVRSEEEDLDLGLLDMNAPEGGGGEEGGGGGGGA